MRIKIKTDKVSMSTNDIDVALTVLNSIKGEKKVVTTEIDEPKKRAYTKRKPRRKKHIFSKAQVNYIKDYPALSPKQLALNPLMRGLTNVQISNKRSFMKRNNTM